MLSQLPDLTSKIRRIIAGIIDRLELPLRHVKVGVARNIGRRRCYVRRSKSWRRWESRRSIGRRIWRMRSDGRINRWRRLYWTWKLSAKNVEAFEFVSRIGMEMEGKIRVVSAEWNNDWNVKMQLNYSYQAQWHSCSLVTNKTKNFRVLCALRSGNYASLRTNHI